MGIGQLFEGGIFLLEGVLCHPKITLVSIVAGVPLVLGAVYSCNKYDEWKAPSRAEELFTATLKNPKKFEYDERAVIFDTKIKEAEIAGYDNPKRLEIECGRKTSHLVNILTPGKTEFSKVIIDREPLGSIDLYINRMRIIKNGKEEINDEVKDLSQNSGDYRDAVQHAYNRLIREANSQLR